MRSFAALAVVATLGLAGLAGCAKGDDGSNVTAFSSGSPSAGVTPSTATSSPGTSGSPTMSTSPTPADPYTFSVEGIGPYKWAEGQTLDSLNTSGVITDISTGGEVCSANYFAKGTGKYSDISLLFTPEKKLDLVIGRGSKIHTPSGAKIGMTLTQLQNIYGSLGETLVNGGARAYIVIVASGKGLYFDLDVNKKVFVMIAGDGARLKNRFLLGSDC